jgi:hypothetical protein
LPPTSTLIRLLKVNPSLLREETIECELCWYELEKAPVYRAISYTWGSNILCRRIIVNGMPVMVTRSAHEVLMNVRSSFRRKTIWIDAICIGQKDKNDKARQIPLMPKIYENASQVIVWLGPSKTAALAVDLVRRIFLINRLRATTGREYNYHISQDGARALKRMLRRPWFGRAWIIQEVVRAKSVHDIIIRYGSESLSWQRFSWFTQVVLYDEKLLKLLSERIGYSGLSNVEALDNTAVLRRFTALQTQQKPLSLLFYLSHVFRGHTKFESEKKKDRVYALMGLCGAANPNLRPDYEQNDASLFIDVVHHLVTTSLDKSRLNFLNHAGLGLKKVTPGLPSWAPDWAASVKCESLIGTDGLAELLYCEQLPHLLADLSILNGFGQFNPIPGEKQLSEVALEKSQKAVEMLKEVICNATPNSTPRIAFLPSNMIEVDALVFDQVLALSNLEFNTEGDDWRGMYETLGSWAEVALSMGNMYGSSTMSSIPSNFVQTLVHDLTSTRVDYTFQQWPAKGCTADAQQSAAEFFQGALERARHFKLNYSIEGEQSLKALAELLRWTCYGRVFGYTKSGRMGLFLPGTQKSDCVALIAGASIPLVLREVKMWSGLQSESGGDVRGSSHAHSIPKFQLVGAAYVQGAMYGIDGMSGGAAQFKPIVIE